MTEDTRSRIDPLMQYWLLKLAAGLRRKVITSDFVGWILTCQFADQISTMFSVVWSFEEPDNSLMSSAYTNTLTMSTATSLLMRSSMKIKKRSGPRTEPWGTPLVTWLGVDKDLFAQVCWVPNDFPMTWHDLKLFCIHSN